MLKGGSHKFNRSGIKWKGLNCPGVKRLRVKCLGIKYQGVKCRVSNAWASNARMSNAWASNAWASKCQGGKVSQFTRATKLVWNTDSLEWILEQWNLDTFLPGNKRPWLVGKRFFGLRACQGSRPCQWGWDHVRKVKTMSEKTMACR